MPARTRRSQRSPATQVTSHRSNVLRRWFHSRSMSLRATCLPHHLGRLLGYSIHSLPSPFSRVTSFRPSPLGQPFDHSSFPVLGRRFVRSSLPERCPLCCCRMLFINSDYFLYHNSDSKSQDTSLTPQCYCSAALNTISLEWIPSWIMRKTVAAMRTATSALKARELGN